MASVEEKARGWDFCWSVERWHEDAVAFAREKIISMPYEELKRYDWGQRAYRELRTGILQAHPDSGTPRRIDGKQQKISTADVTISSSILRDLFKIVPDTEFVPGNLLLQEGIQLLEDLLIGALTTKYDNANSYIGVGDTSSTELASQFELQAANASTNRVYKAMNASYPLRSSQTVSWQSDFGSTEGNFAWNEWTVARGATGGPPLTSGTTNLNRKVQALGTKASGTTWTMTGQVTIA